MAGLSAAGLNYVIGAAFAGTTQVTTFYASLHPADSADGTNELTAGNGYARQSFSCSAASGTVDNDSAITFGAATTDFGNVNHVGIWSAVTGGTFYGIYSFTQKSFDTNDQVQFAAGDLDLTAANA